MESQEWLIERFSDDTNSTLGSLFQLEHSGFDWSSSLDKNFFCFVLEDEHRDVKVMKETRIPAGRYELKIRREDTPLTIKHRVSYNKGYKEPWFDFHIEITNIKNFTGVYLHAGFNDSWTAGCPLLAYQATKFNGRQTLALSIEAMKDFYDIVYPHLDNGGSAFLTIKDENKLI